MAKTSIGFDTGRVKLRGSIHAIKLSVVESIVCFAAKLEAKSFREIQVFVQPQVPIVDARASHVVLACITECAFGRARKSGASGTRMLVG